MRIAPQDLQPILGSRQILNAPASEVPGLLQAAAADPDPGNRFMRMFFILQAVEQSELALAMQAQALAHRQLFRILDPPAPRTQLLALMGPGDMRDNTPLDYLLHAQGVRLDLLYVTLDHPAPEVLPEHDVAILALGESSRDAPLLDAIERMRATWPRPFLNRPEAILRCARDRLSVCLHDPEVLVPATRRLQAAAVAGVGLPFLIRPIDTHGGLGFEKIDSDEARDRYLEGADALEFYVSDYIDYQSADGLFRKFRVALIDRRPFVCHLAIGEHWMVHYKSAGMEQHADRRAEEARFMADFEEGFLARHGAAFERIARTLDCDYVVLDCGLAKDGRLILFEADNRGLIHDTDPVDLFPFKKAVMAEAFSAFVTMLDQASCGSVTLL